MSFRNSPTYVQKIINRILYSFRHFYKTYIDNIMIFSFSLKKHINYLIQIFQTLAKMNIHFTFNKTFLKYLFVRLLNQRVNALNLIIIEKKL